MQNLHEILYSWEPQNSYLSESEPMTSPEEEEVLEEVTVRVNSRHQESGDPAWNPLE